MSHHAKDIKDSDKNLQDPRFEREKNANATGGQKGTHRKLKTDTSGKEMTGSDLGKFESRND